MLLDDSSLGLTYGVNLFTFKEPSTPDNTVTILDTAGMAPQRVLDKANYEYPSVQVRVRNTDALVGYALAYQIYSYLQLRAHETWNSAIYEIIYSTSGVYQLDWDDNQRVRFIINFNLQRR